jgi:single-strand DNA-binding protein
MSAALNRVFLIGNLTRDPEITYTPKGVAVANCSLAVNHSYTTDGGERKEDVTFVDFSAWDKLAENMGKYLAKGSPIFLEGRLQLDQWVDKETNQKRSKLKVVASGVQFLAHKKQEEEEDDRP